MSTALDSPIALQMIAGLGDAAALLDAGDHPRVTNAAYCALVGMSAHELETAATTGSTALTLLVQSTTSTTSTTSIADALHTCRTLRRPVAVDGVRATNRHGQEHTVSVTFIPVVGATGGVEAVVQLVRDISWQERIQLLERSLEDKSRACELLRSENHRLARTDQLTGMLNRMAFDEFASQALELARRHPERGLGIVVCTLDDLRELYDTHGHEAGEAMLVATAQVLSRIVRTADHVARFGGETFVVLLPEVSLDGLHVVGHRCCRSIRTMPCPQTIHGKTTPQTASVGAAWFPAHGETIEALLQSALEAAACAQRDGKNTFRCAQ